MVRTVGRVFETEKGVTVATERPPLPNLGDTVEVIWHDRRLISPDQRRKAWALVGEIAEWAGYTKDEANEHTKYQFRKETAKGMCMDMFSLSNVDMTTARDYISFLIEFMLRNDVPSSRPLYEMSDDIARYVYACAVNKKCAVCGRKAEIHHIDRIGMGGNRDKMNHVGMLALPLCRLHHMEAHDHGDKALLDGYHLEPIKIDEKIARIHKLGRWEK